MADSVSNEHGYLAGQHAAVTGGGRGIGAAIAPSLPGSVPPSLSWEGVWSISNEAAGHRCASTEHAFRPFSAT